MTHRPAVVTFSKYSSALPAGKPNLFWTAAVNSLIWLPFWPRTFCVLVAKIMISVLAGVNWLQSSHRQPPPPSEKLILLSFDDPSATSFLFLHVCTAILLLRSRERNGSSSQADVGIASLFFSVGCWHLYRQYCSRLFVSFFWRIRLILLICAADFVSVPQCFCCND